MATCNTCGGRGFYPIPGRGLLGNNRGCEVCGGLGTVPDTTPVNVRAPGSTALGCSVVGCDLPAAFVTVTAAGADDLCCNHRSNRPVYTVYAPGTRAQLLVEQGLWPPLIRTKPCRK